jgi:2-succinyl-6-hydroxy-2,4-cyclohexadiene-1-carboxylate synthase
MPESVVLLHGFGGTCRAWDGVAELLDPERYRPLALDLPGHGEAADAPRPISFSGSTEHVLANSPERFVLCGYSMGGRVALHIALATPERVVRLVLISTTAGIEDAAERTRRREADRALVEDLERGSYEEFVERWRTQPLFADEPLEVRALARKDQLRNQPGALADVLRGVGTGEMQPLWDRLPELEMPVIVLVGARDRKFLALGQRMAELLPSGELLVVPGGHGLPLENPTAIVEALR